MNEVYTPGSPARATRKLKKAKWQAVFTGVFTDVFTGVFTDVFTDVFPDVVTGAFTGAFTDVFTGVFTDVFTGVFTDLFTDVFTDVFQRFRPRSLTIDFPSKVKFEICSKQLSTTRNRFLTLPKAENLHFNELLTV